MILPDGVFKGNKEHIIKEKIKYFKRTLLYIYNHDLLSCIVALLIYLT